MKHLDEYNVLTKFQHGFRRGHSCESQLIQTMHDLCSNRDKRLQIDMLVLDFSKAFDTVPHHRLMLKLSNYGITGSTHKWISSFLQDRMQHVFVGEHSEWSRVVVSGVPQGCHISYYHIFATSVIYTSFWLLHLHYSILVTSVTLALSCYISYITLFLPHHSYHPNLATSVTLTHSSQTRYITQFLLHQLL